MDLHLGIRTLQGRPQQYWRVARSSAVMGSRSPVGSVQRLRKSRGRRSSHILGKGQEECPLSTFHEHWLNLFLQKALLPVLVCVVVKVDAFGTTRFNSNTDTRSAEKQKSGDSRLLAVLTISALVALSYVSELRATLALGCCNAVLVAVVLSLLQSAHRETVSTSGPDDGVISVSGLLSQPTIKKDTQQVLVDVSFAAALAQWLSAFVLEGFSTRPFWFAFLPQQILMVVLGMGMVIVHAMLNRTMIIAVS
jgi:hypothetical protein